jgi:TonB family protein
LDDKYDETRATIDLRGQLLKKCLILVSLTCIFAPAGSAKAEYGKARANFARQLQQKISALALRKVYVPDFPVSGKQNPVGRFYAASFSKLLTDDSKTFSVIQRNAVHRFLSGSGLTDLDLAKSDVLAKVVSEFSPDAILWGTLSTNGDTLTIDFDARDPSDKELFRDQFSEKIDLFARDMLENDGSEPAYYFVTLDGVTMPKCVFCPDPSYTEKSRSKKVQGRVVLSVLVTAEGKADRIRVVTSLDPDLDRSGIRTVSSWQFQASKDSDGKNVSVRLPVELTFRLK